MTKTSWRSYYCNYRRVSSCITIFLSLTVCSLILMALRRVQFHHSLFGVLSEIVHRKTLIFGFNRSYLRSKRRSEFDLISPNDVTSQIRMAATGRAVSGDLNRNTLKRKKLETHAKTFANALCYQKSHAYTDLIWPTWRWRVQYRKSWIREPVRLLLPSSTSLNPKEAWGKASLFSLPYEPPSRDFQQIVGFSGEMVAYQEVFCVVSTLLTNSTQP